MCHDLRQVIVTPGVAQVAPQPIERRAQQATQVARGLRRLVRGDGDLACGNGLTPSSATQTPLAHHPPKKTRDGTETTHPPLSTLNTCSTKLVSGLLEPDAVYGSMRNLTPPPSPLQAARSAGSVPFAKAVWQVTLWPGMSTVKSMEEGNLESLGHAPSPGSPESRVIMCSCMLGMLHASLSARGRSETGAGAGKAVAAKAKRAREYAVMCRDSMVFVVDR